MLSHHLSQPHLPLLAPSVPCRHILTPLLSILQLFTSPAPFWSFQGFIHTSPASVSSTNPPCPTCSPLCHKTHQLLQAGLFSLPFSPAPSLSQLMPLCWVLSCLPPFTFSQWTVPLENSRFFFPRYVYGLTGPACLLLVMVRARACVHALLSHFSCWTHVDHSMVSSANGDVLGTFTHLSAGFDV